MIYARQGTPVSFGFVIGGATQWREVLIRAVGPGLAQFGVENTATNPLYSLSPNRGYVLPGAAPSSSGWSATSAGTATISAEEVRAGAFPLSPGSMDKADVVLLSPGAYTISVNPTDPSQEGAELVEIYEVE